MVMRCLLGTFSEPSCRLSLGNDQQGRPVIAAVKGVAKRSALRACDRIVSVGGRPITRYEEALAAIRASGDDLQLVVLRDPQAPLLSSPLLSLRSSPLLTAPLRYSPLLSPLALFSPPPPSPHPRTHTTCIGKAASQGTSRGIGGKGQAGRGGRARDRIPDRARASRASASLPDV